MNRSTTPPTHAVFMDCLDSVRMTTGEKPPAVRMSSIALMSILRSVGEDRWLDCATIDGIAVSVDNRLPDNMIMWVLA